MTIAIELEAKILRYYHVEKWRVGTIARQLNTHHSVVKECYCKRESLEPIYRYGHPF